MNVTLLHSPPPTLLLRACPIKSTASQDNPQYVSFMRTQLDREFDTVSAELAKPYEYHTNIFHAKAFIFAYDIGEPGQPEFQNLEIDRTMQPSDYKGTAENSGNMSLVMHAAVEVCEIKYSPKNVRRDLVRTSTESRSSTVILDLIGERSKLGCSAAWLFVILFHFIPNSQSYIRDLLSKPF